MALVFLMCYGWELVLVMGCCRQGDGVLCAFLWPQLTRGLEFLLDGKILRSAE